MQLQQLIGYLKCCHVCNQLHKNIGFLPGNVTETEKWGKKINVLYACFPRKINIKFNAIKYYM